MPRPGRRLARRRAGPENRRRRRAAKSGKVGRSVFSWRVHSGAVTDGEMPNKNLTILVHPAALALSECATTASAPLPAQLCSASWRERREQAVRNPGVDGLLKT